MEKNVIFKLRGRGENDTIARKRKEKIENLARKLTKERGYRVYEAEIIRNAIDAL